MDDRECVSMMLDYLLSATRNTGFRIGNLREKGFERDSMVAIANHLEAAGDEFEAAIEFWKESGDGDDQEGA